MTAKPETDEVGLQRCRALMGEVATDKDWKKLFRALFDQVHHGEGRVLIGAAGLLLKYQFGVPTQPVAADDPDAHAVRIIEVHVDGSRRAQTRSDRAELAPGAKPGVDE